MDWHQWRAIYLAESLQIVSSETPASALAMFDGHRVGPFPRRICAPECPSPKCPPIGGPPCPLESSLISGLSDAANTDNFITEPTHIGLRNGEMNVHDQTEEDRRRGP